MKTTKFLSSLFLVLLISACTPVSGPESEGKFKGQVLTIYNCADYISNGEDDSVDLIEKFEEETGATVKYYTYDTNETMYNQFKLQKEGTYDLVLASDYMIEKFIKEDLIQPMPDYATNIPNYEDYCSPVLRDQFKSMKVNSVNGEVSLDEYSVGYMWGTLGIIYDPTYSDTISEDVKSWNILWDENYKDVISIKNSVREAFVIGLMHNYAKNPDFQIVMNNYLKKDATLADELAYEVLVQEIFDFKFDGSEESINENLHKIDVTKEELIALKSNIFGFETDSGKNDIIEGSKIKMNLAYSGDAVYSIETAYEEADGKVLEYYVPEDGSNKWYDGWMLPKKSNIELSCAFLNFLSNPENASDNIDYIGYTPFITGDAVFTNISNWYGTSEYCADTYYEIGNLFIKDNVLYEVVESTEQNAEKLLNIDDLVVVSLEYNSSENYEIDSMVSKDGKIYNCVDQTGVFEDDFEENLGYDVGHIYGTSLSAGRSTIIYPAPGNENLLETQYPSEKILHRCAVMKDFGEFNKNVVIAWGQVKAATNMVPVYVFLITFVSVVFILVVVLTVKKKMSVRYKRSLKK